MRPRVIRRGVRADEAGNQPASSLQPRLSLLEHEDPRPGSLTCTELWIGMRVTTQTGESVTPAGLEQLAIRAQRFTPRVSLAPPDGLLLEVQGSLHLFKGTTGLMRALADEYAGTGMAAAFALAPTPLAALLAARWGKPFIVTDKARLIGQLTHLPLTLMRWPAEIPERLARMGVRTIGQALRLPRAGFARRFGPGALAELDRLTGRDADLRQSLRPRERFRQRCELTYELESTGRIVAELAPLLTALGNFLRARQCGILKLECLLQHRHAAPSRCVLRLAAPLTDIPRLTELLGERLNTLELPEPVRSCELRSGVLVPHVPACRPLWQPGEHGGGGQTQSHELLERLRARLGTAAVYGLQVLAGHRPENAWSIREPTAGCTDTGGRPPPWSAFHRPLWLLPSPQLLREKAGLPRRRGALRLSAEAERIESGWWDGSDIERDYYIACDIHGVKLWIFRERRQPHRWFLQGVFG
ncbi:MAG TPA: DNA polymerase Y family protein [Steroidobacteraceae bacterium]|nr:DNA polymerase Y family protein [Steroidobacteraceae bacterium]